LQFADDITPSITITGHDTLTYLTGDTVLLNRNFDSIDTMTGCVAFDFQNTQISTTCDVSSVIDDVDASGRYLITYEATDFLFQTTSTDRLIQLVEGPGSGYIYGSDSSAILYTY
jgi:hypothetical protein